MGSILHNESELPVIGEKTNKQTIGGAITIFKI